jgi:hypothetical protein
MERIKITKEFTNKYRKLSKELTIKAGDIIEYSLTDSDGKPLDATKVKK